MSAGKGSSPRNCFSRQFRDNWDAIFSRSERAAEISSGIRRIRKENLSARPMGRTVPPHP